MRLKFIHFGLFIFIVSQNAFFVAHASSPFLYQDQLTEKNKITYSTETSDKNFLIYVVNEQLPKSMVKIVSFKTGKLQDVLEFAGRLSAIDIHPDNRTIVACDQYGTLKLYDIIDRVTFYTENLSGCLNVQFSPDGKFLAIDFSRDGVAVYQYERIDGVLISFFQIYHSSIADILYRQSFYFSPNSKYIAFIDYAEFQIFSLEDLKTKLTVKSPVGSFNLLYEDYNKAATPFSQDGLWFVFGSTEGDSSLSVFTYHVVDLKQMKVVLRTSKRGNTGFERNDDLKNLFAANNKIMKIGVYEDYNIPYKDRLTKFLNLESLHITTLLGTEKISSINDQGLLATAYSLSQKVDIFDLFNGKVIQSFLFKKTVASVTFTPGFHYLIVSFINHNKISIIDMKKMEVVGDFEYRSKPELDWLTIDQLIDSKDQKSFAMSSSRQEAIYYFDGKTKTLNRRKIPSTAYQTKMIYLENSQQLLVGYLKDKKEDINLHQNQVFQKFSLPDLSPVGDKVNPVLGSSMTYKMGHNLDENLFWLRDDHHFYIFQ